MMGNFIELNEFRCFGPNALNRDETGRVKTITVGGVERARFSSQAIKRTIRDEYDESERNISTRYAVGELMNNYYFKEHAGKEIDEKTRDDITYIMSVIANEKKDDKSKYEHETGYGYRSEEVRSYSKAELEVMYSHFKEVYADEDLKKRLLNGRGEEKKAEKPNENSEEKKNEKKKKTKTKAEIEHDKAVNEVKKETEKRIKNAGINMETATFGRMSAAGPGYNVYSSTMFNHPYSIDEFNDEFDTFTAIDTYLRQNGETGAGFIDNASIASNTFYEYKLYNPDQVFQNLFELMPEISREEAIEKVKEDIRTQIREFILAAPSGKQNGMASRPLPKFLMVTFVVNGTNVTMDNCFSEVIAPYGGKTMTRLIGERITKYLCNDRPHQNYKVDVLLVDSTSYDECEDLLQTLPPYVEVMRMNEIDKVIDKLISVYEEIV